MHALIEVLAEHGDEDHSILNTDAKKSNKPDAGRNAEVNIGKMQRQYSTDQCKWHIHDGKHGILCRSECNEQDQEDSKQTYRYHPGQGFSCPLLIFEFSIPGHGITIRQMDCFVYFILPFCNRTSQVPFPDGEFYSYMPGIIIPEN